MASPMDAARRSKDRSYRHVFKGSVLINTLTTSSNERFKDRASAMNFGQSLLNKQHIESVVGSQIFEDGATLYRWCDESVVQQAKKMVTTTSSHIPKKRLIELLDMEHGLGTDGYNMKDMRDRVINKLDRTIPEPEPVHTEPRQPVGRLSRKDLEFAEMHASENDKINAEYAEKFSSPLASLTMDPLGSVPVPNTTTPIYNMTSSTDDYTSTSGNVTTSQSSASSANTESPIDSQMVMDEHENNILPTLSNQSSVFEPSEHDMAYELDTQEQFACAEEFAKEDHTLPAEDRETLLQLEKMTRDKSSLSDNEKALLTQMKKMEENHVSTIMTYEDRMEELAMRINEMSEIAEKMKAEQNALQATAPESGPKPDEQAKAIPAAPAVPGLPPSVPAAPTFGTFAPKVVQPNKPPVKPRVKMRTLFWNRIVLNDKKAKADKTVWKRLTEPNFDVDEFEEMFGVDPAKQNTTTRSLHDAMSPARSGEKVKTVKLLEDNRSRTIGIKLRSMHCQMGDIKEAVYRLHFDKLDVESLFSLYELRGSAEEIAKIEAYMKEHRKRSAALDQPEQFLYEVSRMQHFEERVECLLLRKRFNETLFNIDEQLNTLNAACDSLRNNESLNRVLEVVLAFGNYMNGGTQRGQADGFDISILSKLKDYKSMDNTTTLLQFVVRIHTREYEEDAGQNGAKFKLPDPGVIQQAATVSLKDLEKELRQMQPHLKSHQKKAEKVYSAADKSVLQPFKNKMGEFFDSAHVLLKRQATKYEETKRTFDDTLDYLTANAAGEELTSNSFFLIWAEFFLDYKRYWETEQKRIAKDMFAKIEQRKKERRQKVQRRNSIVEEGRENLKQKFANMRRRSTNAAPHTAMLIRSQSVSSIDTISSQSTNSLERASLERRKRNGGSSIKTGRDDESVFADDEDQKSEIGSVPERRRRREQLEPPTLDDSTARHQAKNRCASESRVDSTPQRNLGKMPTLLNSLGDSNMKIKMYYRKPKDEAQSDSKSEAATAAQPSSPAERHRHRFVPDAVPKTGDSMIERLQQRRQRHSRSSMDDPKGAEGGYESSHTVRASGDETDRESLALQDRMSRRRRNSNLTDDSRPADSNLTSVSAALRRSRTNLTNTDDAHMSLAQPTATATSPTNSVPAKLRHSRTSLLDGTPNSTRQNQDASSDPKHNMTSLSSALRRSRANLSEDLTSTPMRDMNSVSSPLRRSRANLSEDLTPTSMRDMNSVSSTLRRSRTNLSEDGSSLKQDMNSVSGTLRRSRANLSEDAAVPSKQDMSSVLSTLRRSRANLSEDVSSSSANQANIDKHKPARDMRTSGSTLQRSRSNVADSIFRHARNEAKNEARSNNESAPRNVTPMPTRLSRSRTNLLENSTKDSKAEPVGKHSSYLRRSRTNLFDDAKNEGRENDTKARHTNDRSSSSHNLLQARSRFGQSMESVRSVGSIGGESTSSVRNRTRPNLSTLDTRRKLPAEPTPQTAASLQPHAADPSSTWKSRMFDSIKDTVTSASAGITALAQKFDPTIGQNSEDKTRPADTDENHNNPLVKNSNEETTSARRERSRRHSSDVASHDLVHVSVVGSTSVQERSRKFKQGSESQDPKISVAGSSQYTDHPASSRSLRSAKSMDTLNKPLSTVTSGPPVRERLSSYENSHGVGSQSLATRSASESSKESGRRVRNRAGSDLGLSRTKAIQQENSERNGDVVATRDTEALRQRDYRDVLRKLGRTRDSSSEESAKH